MRTTVEIPDPLFRRAKLAAAEEGGTLRELVVRGLEAVLGGDGTTAYRLKKPPVRLSADSPLRQIGAEDVAGHDADGDANDLHEVYRRR